MSRVFDKTRIVPELGGEARISNLPRWSTQQTPCCFGRLEALTNSSDLFHKFAMWSMMVEEKTSTGSRCAGSGDAVVFWMPRVGAQEMVELTKCRVSGNKTRAFSSVVLVEG